jgi:hypothetical protein
VRACGMGAAARSIVPNINAEDLTVQFGLKPR